MKDYIIKKYEDGSMLTVRNIQDVLLKMMKDIDRVCQKHKIPYWLVGGSALGAVRHKGFIPWDDDMDISMMREDYERFLKEAVKDLPDCYVLQSFDMNKKTNVCVPVKIILKNTHVQEYNVLLKSKCEHGDGLFIDIFVCDHVSMNRSQDLPRRLVNASLMPVITLLENLHVNPILLKKCFVNNAKAYNQKCKDSEHIGFAITWCFNSLLKPIRYPKESIFPVQYVEFEDTLLPIPRYPKAMLDIEISPSHMTLPPEKARKPKHIKDAQL